VNGYKTVQLKARSQNFRLLLYSSFSSERVCPERNSSQATMVAVPVISTEEESEVQDECGQDISQNETVIDMRNNDRFGSPLVSNCRTTQPVPPVYKEMVVIGNGPSGIALSYFLAGNWPYYNGLGEDTNDMLHYRLLSNQSGQVSLVEQDLNVLSQVSN